MRRRRSWRADRCTAWRSVMSQQCRGLGSLPGRCAGRLPLPGRGAVGASGARGHAGGVGCTNVRLPMKAITARSPPAPQPIQPLPRPLTTAVATSNCFHEPAVASAGSAARSARGHTMWTGLTSGLSGALQSLDQAARDLTTIELEDDDDEYGEEHARCHAERPEASYGGEVVIASQCGSLLVWSSHPCSAAVLGCPLTLWAGAAAAQQTASTAN